MRLNKNFNPKLLFVLFIVFAIIFYVLYASQQNGLRKLFGKINSLEDTDALIDSLSDNDLSLENMIMEYSEDDSLNTVSKSEEDDISEVPFLEPVILLGNNIIEDDTGTKENDSIIVLPQDIIVPEQIIAAIGQDVPIDFVKELEGEDKKVQFLNVDEDQVDEEAGKESLDPEDDIKENSKLIVSEEQILQNALKPLVLETDSKTKQDLEVKNPDKPSGVDKVEEFMFEQEKKLREEFDALQADSRKEYKDSPMFALLDSILTNAEDKLLADVRKDTKDLLGQINAHEDPEINKSKRKIKESSKSKTSDLLESAKII